MQEKIFFKNSSGQKLAGVLHVPNNKKKYPAVVMLHGRGSDKETHDKTGFADSLMKHGFIVLRFDMPGCGESDGRMEEMTISSEVDSAKAAIDFLCKQKFVDSKRIELTGSSQGGFDSLVLAPKDSRIKALVTVSAVIDFDETFSKRGTDLKQWKKDGFSIIGKRLLKLNYSYVEDIKKYDMKKIVPKIKCPTLVLHGDRDETVPVSQAHQLYKLLKCEKSMHIIKGAKHNFEGNEIEERLAYTIKWFNKWLK